MSARISFVKPGGALRRANILKEIKKKQDVGSFSEMGDAMKLLEPPVQQDLGFKHGALVAMVGE